MKSRKEELTSLESVLWELKSIYTMYKAAKKELTNESMKAIITKFKHNQYHT